MAGSYGPFRVMWTRWDGTGEEIVFQTFATERDARAFINVNADGSIRYSLWHDTDAGSELIVRSAFPVLMVA